MKKEELIRNLRYTEKKHRNDIVNTFDTDISMMCSDVLKVLENCIEIPNGATNGDMIKAMFPSSEVREIMDDLVHYTLDGYVGAYIPKDWWNAPYRIDEESEDEK